jgi:predicted acylesterase/phospholipase RssA
MTWLEWMWEQKAKAYPRLRRLRASPTTDPLMQKLEALRLVLGETQRTFVKQHLPFATYAAYRRWLRQGAPDARSEQYRLLAGRAQALEREIALRLVADHLVREEERTGRWPDNLTTQKLWDRAQLRDDPQRPHCIVFEVERHRSLIPGGYTPGAGMSAFEAYWPIYAYDPQKDTLDIVGEARDPRPVVNVKAVVDDFFFNSSLEVEPCGEGLFRVRWEFGKAVVRSLEEARPLVREWASRLGWDVSAEEFLERGSKEEIEALTQELREAAADKAEEMLEDAWEDMRWEYMREDQPPE